MNNKIDLIAEDSFEHKKLPEIRLMWALLARVIMDLFLDDQMNKREAVSFLKSKKSNKIPFSFRWICLYLELDPDHVRESIRKHTQAF